MKGNLSIFAIVMFLSGFTLVSAYINWKGIHEEMGQLDEMTETEDYILKHGGRLPFEAAVQGRLTGINKGVELYMGEAIQKMSGVRDDEKLKAMMTSYCIEATSDEEIKRDVLFGRVVFGSCLFFAILNIKAALRKRKLNKRWQQALKATSPSS